MLMSQISHKLGVIVPFRLRDEHLKIFIDKIDEHLKNQNIDYELIVVNQDNAKQFNRGMLLNIGYMYAKKLKCDYLVFHDVDMVPIDVDYSYSDVPLHLATSFVDQDGVELEFEQDSLDLIADRTLAKKTGARGLHSEIERVLMPHMYNLQNYKEHNIVKIAIDKNQVNTPIKLQGNQ